MCSTNPPNKRRLTGATTKPGSTIKLADGMWGPPILGLLRSDGWFRRRGLPRRSRSVAVQTHRDQGQSALETAACKAFDDLALEDQEQDHEGQRAEDGGGLDVGQPLPVRALHG